MYIALNRGMPFHKEHIKERYNCFALVVLGETVLSMAHSMQFGQLLLILATSRLARGVCSFHWRLHRSGWTVVDVLRRRSLRINQPTEWIRLWIHALFGVWIGRLSGRRA